MSVFFKIKTVKSTCSYQCGNVLPLLLVYQSTQILMRCLIMLCFDLLIAA